jgi:uncharacterized protein
MRVLSRETKIHDVSIIETCKTELKEPLVILGFVGPGLVGGIAVTHTIEQLKMKEIAHVRSLYIPPAALFIDGILRRPFRIYAEKEGKLCAVVCEIPIRSDGSYPIAISLLDWAEGKGAKELVVLEGFQVQEVSKVRKTFCVAEPEKINECKEKGVDMASAGIIGGIAGSILNECLTRKITGVAFLTPAHAFIPDPEGAAALVETLNRVYGLSVDTKELLNRSEEIRQKLKEVSDRHQMMRRAEEERGTPERIYV